jgi:hypothetical protein
MEVPQRHHTDRVCRQVVNVAVAMNMVTGTYAKESTGTAYDGCPPMQQYTTGGDTPAKALTSQEYISFLESLVTHLHSNADFCRLHAKPLLVHDRSPVHKSKDVQQWLQREHIDVKLAPPRSPDLMPPDYGLFGTVKQQLSLEMQPTAPWDPRAERFMQLIRTTPVDKSIMAFTKRLEACIEAGGGHFEQALRHQD